VNLGVVAVSSYSLGQTQRVWQPYSARRAKEIEKVSKRAQEFWLADGQMFLSQAASESGDEEDKWPSEDLKLGFGAEKAADADGPESKQSQSLPIHPSQSTPICLHKRRHAPSGKLALGSGNISPIHEGMGWFSSGRSDRLVNRHLRGRDTYL
jgi:hypothetical protein